MARPKGVKEKGPRVSKLRPVTLAKRRLEVFYGRMSDHTKGRCGAPCGKESHCCKPLFCEMTAQYAREVYNIQLTRTKHPDLPFLGPHGCTVAPHLRPHCTMYVCDNHFDDAEFKEHYDWLKKHIDQSELELHGVSEGQWGSPGSAGSYLRSHMEPARPE